MENKSNIIKRLTDFPSNRENPFIPNLIIPTKKGTIAFARTKDKGIIDRNTGEIDDSLFIAIKKEIDKEEFVKIFHAQLRNIFDLSKSGLKVFSYFMNISNYNDELDFDLQDCMKFSGYTAKETIFSGIAELLNKNIIARGKNPYKYYSNPSVFYKGDRVVLMTDYSVKKKKGLELADVKEVTDIFLDEKI